VKIFDLSATVSENLPVFGGDPNVKIVHDYEIANGSPFNTSTVTLCSHSGTHADMPKHFVDDGFTCENVPLDKFFGKAKVFDLRRALCGRKIIEAADLEPYEIICSDIILLNTGCSRMMRNRAFDAGYVSLSPCAAKFLADKKIKTLGIDYLSVDRYGDEDFSAHMILLGGGVTILEGLVFDENPIGFVPQGGYAFSALPLKFENGNGSPVRAALFDESEIKLVLFDMDGLILDTEKIYVKAWEGALARQGFALTQPLVDRLLGCGPALCRERMEDAFGPEFIFQEAYDIRKIFLENYFENNPIDVKQGTNDLLDLLDEGGVPKCVATSTPLSRAEYMLDKAGIKKRFDKIIAGDMIERGKPDPEIFLKGASFFDAGPNECAVLEDSATGVEAARAGGFRAVFVPDLAAPCKNTLAGSWAVCENLFEVAKLIKFFL